MFINLVIGKTTFVHKLLLNRDVMIKPNVQELRWYHGQKQPFHERLKRDFPEMMIIQGLPDMEEFDPSISRLIILDDLMSESNESVAKIFTVGKGK